MARFTPLWQQGDASHPVSYPASQDRALLNALWPGGGASGAPVVAVGGSMNVSIPAGAVAVPLQAGQGSVLCRWDAAEVVALDAATHPAGQTRIDNVVCQVQDNAIDSGGVNGFVFQRQTGTPAASNPVAPTVPNNAFLMCRVTVPGAVADLSTATFTDMRGGGLLVPNGKRAPSYYPTTNQNISLTTAFQSIFGANLGVTFNKRHANSRLVVAMAGSTWLPAASVTTNMTVGLQVGTTDVPVALAGFPGPGVRMTYAGYAELTGLGAGAYAITPRVRGTAATTVAFNTPSDYLSYAIEEAS